MKKMMNERLVHLAAAQENIVDVVDKIEQWEQSQLILEKSAFDSINTSDKILNLSREGNKLVDTLREYCNTGMSGDKTEDKKMVATWLNEMQGLFDDILGNTQYANEVAHSLELETALQREIGERMKGLVSRVIESVDSAAACTEFILADL